MNSLFCKKIVYEKDKFIKPQKASRKSLSFLQFIFILKRYYLFELQFFPSLSNTLTIFCQTNLCELLSASQERQIVKVGLSGSIFSCKT